MLLQCSFPLSPDSAGNIPGILESLPCLGWACWFAGDAGSDQRVLRIVGARAVFVSFLFFIIIAHICTYAVSHLVQK